MICSITLSRLRIPLKEPYKLAFGPVTHFDTVLAEIETERGRGIGEATYLPGYSDETVAQAWLRLVGCAAGIVEAGAPPGEAALAARAAAHHLGAFSSTALVTAFEMAEGSPLLAVAPDSRIRLLAGLNATDEAGIARELERHITAGYDTIKVKAGFDWRSDLARVGLIQRLNRGRARLRVDGNQGFSPGDGCSFASGLDPDSIELLEQPCAADDWAAAEAVARVSTVPLMLDESIFTFDDIDRAARVGAKLVKLKLMKMGSLRALDAGLYRIRALGLEPVLGNGVASDIGCWMEACVGARHLTNAGEMNGFLRQARSLSVVPMRVEGGHVAITGRPVLDGPAREAVTIEQRQFAFAPGTTTRTANG